MTKKGKRAKISLVFVTALVTVLCVFGTLLSACGKVTITLDKTDETIYVGDTVKITATVSDDDADVEWSSSNTNVATVRKGTVTAVAEGTAVITAQVEDGVSATCNITVATRTVTISKTEASINLDESDKLTLTATSSDNGKVNWSSSNPSVADVVDGVVTAYDIGEVTVTAKRGAASADCVITVTQPSRPADYYKITKKTNLECVNDAGVWHFHGDGSQPGDYDFEKEPVHANNTVSVTLSVIPNVENEKYFYFRYQPNQVELNNYYKITVAITVSSDATIRLASRGADNKAASLMEDFVANTERTVSYIGYRNENEPFSARINSAVDADKVSYSLKLISVEAYDGELPEYHIHDNEPQVNYEQIANATGEYDMELKNNAGTVSAPGSWYYNQGDGSTISEAKYNNGEITLKFGTLKTSGNNQLRFRPEGLSGSVKIKVEFTLASNVDANVTLALCDSETFKSVGSTTKTVNADGTVTFSSEFTMNEKHLIFIEIKAKDEEKTDAAFTVTELKVSKEAAAQA